MRTAIYVRVSTKRQEKKYSLEGQRDDLTAYAQAQGWEIVSVLQDIESGAKLDKKGLNQLLDLVEDRAVDVVLVAEQDRLSRLDTIEWEFLKGTLRENGVKLAQPGRMTDLTNEDDVFMSDLHNLLAQKQRRGIVRSMMRGKRRRMREGRGFGKPPFGYLFDAEKKEYVIDERWAWTIPMMDRLYLQEQLGMVSIAQKMNEVGPTPSGGEWNETLIHRRLISKAFHGVMEKSFANGETIAIEGIYPPLRSEQTYNRIQEERKRRAEVFRVSGRARDELHLFRRTLFTCDLCGRKLNVEQNGTREHPRYYIKHGRKRSIRTRETCELSFNTVLVEAEALSRLKELLQRPELAEKYYQVESALDEVTVVRESLRRAEKQLEQINGKLDRLLDLYLDGKFSKEKLEKREADLEKEKERLTNDIESMKSKLHLIDKEAWLGEMIALLGLIAENLDSKLTSLELAITFGRVFPEARVGENYIDLITVVKGAPFKSRITFDNKPLPRGRKGGRRSQK